MQHWLRPFVIPALIAATLIGQPANVWAAMASTNYQIDADSFSFGGQNGASSTSYSLNDGTGAVAGFGQGTSASYTVNQGLRGSLQEPFVQFSLLVPDLSTEVALTTQPSASVYTFASVAGYTSGDSVLLISDAAGVSPSYRIGTISDITSTDVTVSIANTDGDYDALTIDGTGDVAYKLSTGSSIGLGLLSTSAVTRGYVVMRMGAYNDQGGTVYAYQDTDLTDGSHTIPGVADGTVSVGSSEYGALSSDSSLASSTFDTQDSAFSTTLEEVMSRGVMAPIEYDVVTLKAAISTTQTESSYAHNLTFVYVGDY